MMAFVLAAAAAAPTALPEGLWGYLFLLGVAVLFHEPWRWLGIVLGRDLDVDSALFAWVRAVANALVAALIARLILFPAGALGGLSTGCRMCACGVGLAVFMASGRKMAWGVLAGAATLVAVALAVG